MVETEDEREVSSLKSCDFPPPFFPPFLNASWFLLALNRSISSALRSLVDGTGLGCHLWPQSSALVMFCLFAPGWLMENTVVYRGWVVFPPLSWILFSSFLKKPLSLSGVGFVFRLVEGQTLLIIAGFSKCLPRAVFLSWQGCSLGGFPSQHPWYSNPRWRWLLFLLLPVSRGAVCVDAWVQGCVMWEVCTISPVSSAQRKEMPIWGIAPAGDWFDLCRWGLLSENSPLTWQLFCQGAWRTVCKNL